MQKIYYYLTLFPTEALIASQLAPESFGVYMSTGPHRGSAEPLTFVELTGDLSGVLDTAYAEAECQKLPEGVLKNSMYLSIYRCLEMVPLANLGRLHLVTRDGRSLGLDPQKVDGNLTTKPVYLYQELCPVRPLVVSKLEPIAFCRYMTDPAVKINVPKVALVDFKVLDVNNLENSGNIGGLYHSSPLHIQECFDAVQNKPGKQSKILGRSKLETFGYQLIDTGVFIADQKDVIFYRMKTLQELNAEHYAWAKSAMIL